MLLASTGRASVLNWNVCTISLLLFPSSLSSPYPSSPSRFSCTLSFPSLFSSSSPFGDIRFQNSCWETEATWRARRLQRFEWSSAPPCCSSLLGGSWFHLSKISYLICFFVTCHFLLEIRNRGVESRKKRRRKKDRYLRKCCGWSAQWYEGSRRGRQATTHICCARSTAEYAKLIKESKQEGGGLEWGRKKRVRGEEESERDGHTFWRVELLKAPPAPLLVSMSTLVIVWPKIAKSEKNNK